MTLYIKYLILILITVKNSTFNIPNCDYFDTVDISDAKRIDDTYLYNGIAISSNRTAEYSHRQFLSGRIEPVETHLRACVCELKTCVRICCARKNMLSTGKCNDGLSEEISFRMLNITVYEAGNLYPNLEEVRKAPLSNLTELFVLREQFQKCDEMISLREDDYRILKDGEIILYSIGQIWPKEYYCFYPQFNPDISNSFWALRHVCTKKMVPAENEVRLISVICYILTLFVYLYVKKLRNFLGKCLISTFFCSLMNDLSIVLDEQNFLNHICLLAGYSTYFFRMASEFWVSALSFHLWQLLTNRSDTSSFATYSAFAWGMAAIPTGFIYVMNLVWAEDPNNWNWLPLVGFSTCGLEAFGPSFWLYLQGPVMTIAIFSMVMFIRTVIHVWKVKRELNRFKRDEERTIQCFNFDTKTYLMFLRLSVIMGAIWILDFVAFLDGFSFFKPIQFVSMYITRGFGIIVFVLLILKPSTLELLMERIRGKRQKVRQCTRRTTKQTA